MAVKKVISFCVLLLPPLLGHLANMSGVCQSICWQLEFEHVAGFYSGDHYDFLWLPGLMQLGEKCQDLEIAYYGYEKRMGSVSGGVGCCSDVRRAEPDLGRAWHNRLAMVEQLRRKFDIDGAESSRRLFLLLTGVSRWWRDLGGFPCF
jgi:hypothetical protein